MSKVRIGTRGSKLALWQAYHIQDLIGKVGLESEIVIIDTKGDQILDRSLSKIGSKGVFTEELELQLREGKIDIAVHSAKDMPSQIAEDLELIAFTEREKVNDVLISLNKNIDLYSKIVIGTSSTRRRAQLLHKYPQVKLVEMRGNLQTRMQKLERGDAEAIMLAYAGVHRMEMEQYIVHEFPIDTFTPSTGQGSVAVQCAVSLNAELKDKLRQSTNHANTEFCVLAERAFLRTLEGGCSVPIFANAILNGDDLQIKGGVVSLDGKQMIRGLEIGNKNLFSQIGVALANDLIAKGAKEILSEIKKTLNHD